MEVIWRSSPVINNTEMDVRIIDLDGEKVLELVSASSPSLWERIKKCLKYIVHGTPVVTHMVLLDDEFNDMCKKVVKA